MITLSKSELEALDPCDMHRRRAMFGFTGRKRLNVIQALDAGASTQDILWVASRLDRKDLCVRFALLCAQRVAYLNRDQRVQKALDTAQAWLGRPSAETANAAYAATNAYAAYAAANAAAYAANAAAYSAKAAAAYAAYYAAYAAANAAAYAPYAAADSAAYAVKAAAYTGDDANAERARLEEQEEQRKILIQVMSGETAYAA
jgi:hypothetical protein